MNQIVFPQKRGSFYLLKPFLKHQHDSSSCELVYVVPWIDGVFITTRRLSDTQGCVGCFVRRLLSTIYHKAKKINSVDSLWCMKNLETDDTILELAQQSLQASRDPTLCNYYKWNSMVPEEVHAIPVPSCHCAKQAPPKLDIHFVRNWLHQWPNVILHKSSAIEQFTPFHIVSSSLPNTSWLFAMDLDQEFHIPSNPTAAAFRNSSNLYDRLLGESIERYSLKYLPFDELYIDESLQQRCEHSHFEDLHTDIWTHVHNLEGTKLSIKADRIYNVLHRINSNKFLPVSSSGVAAHFDPEIAKLNALLEILERDALIVAWRLAGQSKLSCLTQIPDTIILNIKEERWLRQLLYKKQRSLVLRGVKNQFGIPICLAVSVGYDITENIHPLFGSGIAFYWEDSIKKALNEILQGIDNPNFDIQDRLPSTFMERPAFWAKDNNSRFLRTFLDSTSDFEHTLNIDSYEHLLARLVQQTQKIYFANITPPDVKLGGWHVVRAIGEDFEPFASGYQHEKPSLTRINHYLKAAQHPLIAHINTKPFPYP